MINMFADKPNVINNSGALLWCHSPRSLSDSSALIKIQITFFSTNEYLLKQCELDLEIRFNCLVDAGFLRERLPKLQAALLIVRVDLSLLVLLEFT